VAILEEKNIHVENVDVTSTKKQINLIIISFSIKKRAVYLMILDAFLPLTINQ
jgi:hypothetical protein